MFLIYNGLNHSIRERIDIYNVFISAFDNPNIRPHYLIVNFHAYENALIQLITISRDDDSEWYGENKYNLLCAVKTLIRRSYDFHRYNINQNILIELQVLERQVHWVPYLFHQKNEFESGLIEGVSGAISSPIKMIFHPIETVKSIFSVIQSPILTTKAICSLAYKRPTFFFANLATSIVSAKIINAGLNGLAGNIQNAAIQTTSSAQQTMDAVENAKQSANVAILAEKASILDKTRAAADLAEKTANVNQLSIESLNLHEQAAKAKEIADQAQKTLDAATRVRVLGTAKGAAIRAQEISALKGSAGKLAETAQALIKKVDETAELAKQAKAAADLASEASDLAQLIEQAAVIEKTTKLTDLAKLTAEATEKTAMATEAVQEANRMVFAIKTARQVEVVSVAVAEVQDLTIEDSIRTTNTPYEVELPLNSDEQELMLAIQNVCQIKAGSNFFAIQNLSPNAHERDFLKFIEELSLSVPKTEFTHVHMQRF